MCAYCIAPPVARCDSCGSEVCDRHFVGARGASGIAMSICTVCLFNEQKQRASPEVGSLPTKEPLKPSAMSRGFAWLISLNISLWQVSRIYTFLLAMGFTTFICGQLMIASVLVSEKAMSSIGTYIGVAMGRYVVGQALPYMPGVGHTDGVYRMLSGALAGCA